MSRFAGTGLAGALSALGLGMILLAFYSTGRPKSLPYDRKIDATSKAALVQSSKELATMLEEAQYADLKRAEWRVEGIRESVASAFVATQDKGPPIALDWHNNVTEPVFSADVTPAEVAKVMAAIKKNVPAEAVVLSWWDLSRKIRLLTGRQAPLDDPRARGFIMPVSWNAVAEDIAQYERSYWGKGVPESDAEQFKRFIEALLADEATGADKLIALAGGKEAFIAVHLSDIWKIASSQTARLSIGYRDFAASGQSHGAMKATREWIKSQGIDGGYAVEPIGHAIRLHYLNDKDSSKLLIARLLPFSTSNPMHLNRLQLVYQHRGFWIYKLTPSGQ